MGQPISRGSCVEMAAGRTELPDSSMEPTAHGAHSHLERVFNFFSTLSQTEMLEYCLGYDKPGAPKLAEHTILIALKCHSLNTEPYSLLEIGIHSIPRHDAKKELENPGPHSLNILRRIAYHHMVIEENACHANRLPNPRDAEINRFGATRCINMEDAKDVLDQMFRKATMIKSPENSNSSIPCLCPIVVLNYDEPRVPALQSAFNFDPSIERGVAATINTTSISREIGFPRRNDATKLSQSAHNLKVQTPGKQSAADHAEITLSQLTQDLKIEYPDQQSAADQAAYALINAIQLVVQRKMPLARESIRSVVNTTMLYSQSNVPEWGEKDLCTVCGDHGHRRLKCSWIKQEMVECWKCSIANRLWVMRTHTPDMCPYSEKDNWQVPDVAEGRSQGMMDSGVFCPADDKMVW